MNLKRVRLLVATVASVSLIGTLVVVALAQQGPTRPHEVAGPDVGPSGQTGDLHYFDNPPSAESPTPTQFGPYRVFPPGSRVQNREYPDDPDPVEYRPTKDQASLANSPLHLAPPTGYREVELSGTERRGVPQIVSAHWASGSDELDVVAVVMPTWRLPIDVYLDVQERRLEQRLTRIAGHEAVVEQPKSGPTPGLGYVRVWMNGWELVLTSTVLGQDRLEALAEQLVPIYQDKTPS